jgi:hypothetical protein
MNVMKHTLLVAIVGWILSSSGWTQTEVTNPDGTKTTVYDQDTEAAKQKGQSYDPYRRASGDSAVDPRISAAKVQQQFPEERAKELKKQAERARMSAEEKAEQKRMLDRTPKLSKGINATLKERKSFPNRF